MRLTVIDAMRARLEAGGLATWADTYGQPTPKVMVGYDRPRTADGWPFVALVPTTDKRDLINGTLDALTISVICGVRAGDSDQADGAGLRAVDALSDACVEVLTAPRIYAVGSRHLVCDYAELTDQVLVHPHYELELRLSMRLV